MGMGGGARERETKERRKESGLAAALIGRDRFHYLNTRKTISLFTRFLLLRFFSGVGTRLPFPLLLFLLSRLCKSIVRLRLNRCIKFFFGQIPDDEVRS